MGRTVLVALGAALATVVSAGPAAAAHSGAVVDCGPSGQFVVRGTAQSDAGYDSPPPHGVMLFEGGASLTILELTVDGRSVQDHASNGATHNGLEEVACTFSMPNGALVVVTGILRTWR